MKFSLALAAVLAVVAPLSTTASKSDCERQYGPPPQHPVPVPAPVWVPPPVPAPVWIPPPPAPSAYAPTAGGWHRELTFDTRCAKYGYWRDRKLMEERNLKVVSTMEIVADHGAKCSHVDYDIYLVIQGAHFAGLGVPVGKENAECPNIVMHSKSDGDAAMEKVAMIAGNDEVVAVQAEEKLHLGTRPMSSIVDAFDGVEAGKNGLKFYDAITNNCVALLRNMADPLDITIDDRMIGFVSKRMMQSSADHIFESIRSSPALSSLYEGGKRMLKGMSNEDLLAKMIKLYV